MKLYFIRHFESEANANDLLGGQIDYHLTIKGHEQAKAAAGRFFCECNVDLIISSPLARAYETAEAFASFSTTPIKIDPCLIEQDMGVFSGKKYSWAEAHPDYELDKTKRWEWTPPGGESYKSISERLVPFFTRLEAMSNKSETRILIVTHAVTLRMIQAMLENTLPEYPTKLLRNGEILETEFKRLEYPEQISFRYYGTDVKTKE